MTVGERAAECDADVLVSFGESLQVYAGLLTVATVCGGLCGVLAASLLYVLCVKPLLLTKQVSAPPSTLRPPPFTFMDASVSRQGYNARRLLEPDDGELDHNPSDTKEAASLTNNDKVPSK